MRTGELFINDKDAFTTWGIRFDSSALSALMTPAPIKEHVTNESRQTAGVYYLTGYRYIQDERTITLTFTLTADTEEQFFERWNSFCEELKGGEFEIRTAYQPDVVYKCGYQSCSQFTEYQRTMAQFSLKLVEFVPTDRSAE